MHFRLLIISLMVFATVANCKSQKKAKKETANSTVVTTSNSASSNTSASTTNTTSAGTKTPTEPVKTATQPVKSTTTPVKTAPSSTSTKTNTTNSQTVDAKKEGIKYFKEGETLFLPEQQMNVTFSKTIEDSRCPKGVNCIWQGVGTAEIIFMSVHSRPVKFNLSTNSVPGKSYEKYFKFSGYTISLVSLEPHPTENSGFDKNQGKYVVGLKFEKGDKEIPTDARTTTK